jgi:hypothetical protein
MIVHWWELGILATGERIMAPEEGNIVTLFTREIFCNCVLGGGGGLSNKVMVQLSDSTMSYRRL